MSAPSVEGEYTLLSDVMVPMRDGVRLATDVYLPRTAGQFPVILERTPYDKTAPSRSERTPSNPTPMSRAQVAEFFGEAPANKKSCALTAEKNHCDIFHAEDEAYFDRVAYWTTPTKNCGDDRGAVCKDYSEWVAAWTEVKG